MTVTKVGWVTLTRLLIGVILLLLFPVAIGCGGGDSENPPPAAASLASIAVNPPTATVGVGAKQQYAVTGTYTDGTTKAVTDGVEWKSSDAAVATVSNSGLATAVASGTATITATVGTLSGTATLTVKQKALTSVQVTPPTATIGYGTTQQFAATANYDDGTTETVTSSATWTSSATNVATINASGLATAAAAGTTTITAEYNGQTGTAVLTVSAAALTSITVDPATASIPAGTTQAFTATAHYEDGTSQSVTTQVTWDSSDTAIATIDATGTAHGLTAGEVDITATLNSVTGTATLTVTAAELTDLQVEPALQQAYAGGPTVQYTARAYYSDGTDADVTDQATWSSSDDLLATIDTAGLATPVAAGTVTITADFDTLSATGTLVIGSAVVTSIQVEPAQQTIAAGTTLQYTATATFSNGDTSDVTLNADWQSGTVATATIDANTGLATGVAAGTSEISATYNGQTGTATLTVTDAQLQAIQVTPVTKTIALNGTQQYQAMGTYTGGSTQDITTQVTWHTSVATVASIGANTGLATGLAAGNTEITATMSGITSNIAVLTVNGAQITSITVSPSTDDIAVGIQRQFTATANYNDGSSIDVTSAASWSSSDTAIATVTTGQGAGNGLATGMGAGTATITATFSATSGTATLNVTAKQPDHLVISPATDSVVVGLTKQYTAQLFYTDNTWDDVTATAAWNSSSNAVATISAAGLATGVSAGTTTITATYGGTLTSNNATLVVSAPTMTAITIVPDSISIAAGTEGEFTAIADYDNGSQIDVTSAASWSSGTTTVATTTALKGQFHGVALGTATVTATLNSFSDTATVNVTQATIVDVEISPPLATVANGLTQTFTATARLSDGNTQPLTTNLTWHTSAPTIASITNAGVAKGLSKGTSNITVTYAGVTPNVTSSIPAVLTVTDAVPSTLTITPQGALGLPLNTERQYTATVTWSDGTTAPTNVSTAATWDTASHTIASVQNGAQGGLVKGLAQGSTTISASYTLNGVTVSDTEPLTVSAAALTEIVLETDKTSIAKGTDVKFNAYGKYTDNVNRPYALTSAAMSITPTAALSYVSVAAGVVTYKGAAVNPAIAVTLQGITVPCNTLTIAVTNATIVSIQISHGATYPGVTTAITSLAEGATEQFYATATLSDTTTANITTDAATTWTSSQPTKLAISNATGSRGLATGLVAGNSTVTCTNGTVPSTNSIPVTVTAPVTTLSYIKLTHNSDNSSSWTSGSWTGAHVGDEEYFYAEGCDTTGACSALTTGTWTIENQAGTVVTNISLGAVSGESAKRLATAEASTLSLPGGVAYVRVRVGTVETKVAVDITSSTVSSISVDCTPNATNVACMPANLTTFSFTCKAQATYSDGTTGDITSSADWRLTTVPASGVLSQSGNVFTIAGTPGTISIDAYASTTSTVHDATPFTMTTVAGMTLATNGVAVTPANTSTLYVGLTKDFVAKASYTGTCGTNVLTVTTLASWDTDAHGIATVGANTGVATGVGAGTTTIRATYSTQSGTAPITVSSACVEDVLVADVGSANKVPTDVVVPLSASVKLSGASSYTTLTPADGGAWSVQNGTFTVNTSTWKLQVGTTAPGTVTYTPTNLCPNVDPGSITITVDTAAVLTGLGLLAEGASTPQSINTGASLDFIPTATFTTYGAFNVTPYATWAITPALAGLTHAAATAPATTLPAERFTAGTTEGETNIVANYKTKTSNAINLTVGGATPVSVTVKPASFTPSASSAYPGGITVNTVADVLYSDNTTKTNPAGLTWTSNSAALTFADATKPIGKTHAQTSDTTVTITATIGGKQGTGTISVNTAALTAMKFSPTSPLSVGANTVTPLTVTGTFTRTTPAYTRDIDISSDVSYTNLSPTTANAGVGTNDPLVINALLTGTAVVNFSLPGHTLPAVAYTVTVGAATCISAASFTIAPTADIALGKTTDFRPVGTYNTGSATLNLTTVGAWTSSPAGIVDGGVNVAGTDTLMLHRFNTTGKGTTTVTFTYTDPIVCNGGNTADHTIKLTKDVTVVDKTLTALTIYPKPVNGPRAMMPANQDIQLVLEPTYSDNSGAGTDLADATGVNWQINNTGAASATVDQLTGLLHTGATVGVDQVTVTLDGVTATRDIDVYTCTRTVSVTPTAAATLAIGQTKDYTAKATYTLNATTCPLAASELGPYDVTTLATWWTSDTSKADFTDGSVPNRIEALAATGTTANTVHATYKGTTSSNVSLSVVAITLNTLSISATPTTTVVGGTLELKVVADWIDSSSNHYSLPPPATLSWIVNKPTLIGILKVDDSTYTLTGVTAGTGITVQANYNDTVLSNVLTTSVGTACYDKIEVVGGDATYPANTRQQVGLLCYWSDRLTNLAHASAVTCPVAVTTFTETGTVVDGLPTSTTVPDFYHDGLYNVLGAPGATGVITAQATGGAVCGTQTATQEITVGSATLTGFDIDPTPTATIARGEQFQFAANATFGGGTGSGTYDVAPLAAWTSTNAAVGTFDANGLFTAKDVPDGSTTIASATYGGMASSLTTVTIADKVPTSVTISADPNRTTAVTGADAEYPALAWNLQLHARVQYSDGTYKDDPTLAQGMTWSLGTAVGDSSIDSAGLLTTASHASITADGIQTVNASYLYNSVTKTDTFTVRMVRTTAADVGTVVITNTNGSTPATSQVPLGLQQDYAAQATYGTASYWATRNLAWDTDAHATGTVTQSNGDPATFDALAIGSTTMTAETNATTPRVGQLLITVSSAVPQYLYCAPASVPLAVGDKAQLHAFLHNSSGPDTDVTSQAGWVSADPGVAAFMSTDLTGVITGVKQGTVKATPSYLTFTADATHQCTITVP